MHVLYHNVIEVKWYIDMQCTYNISCYNNITAYHNVNYCLKVINHNIVMWQLKGQYGSIVYSSEAV